MRAISPPTPAPSPQPSGSSRFPPPTWSPTQPTDDELVQSIRTHFSLMSPHVRLRLLTQLLADSSPALLSPLLPLITPRLKRDFLKTLPLELAFHVLSFVDDVRTLARASGVSRFWRALLEDEGTWKRMCWKSGFGAVGSRLRTLEFGEREEEEGTPAGRERRGTLDREGLREFAARAELFGLRPSVGDEPSWNSVGAQPERRVPVGWESWRGLGFQDDGQPVASGSGSRRPRVVDHNPSPVAPNPFPLDSVEDAMADPDERPTLAAIITSGLSASLPITPRSHSLSSSLPASTGHSPPLPPPRRPFSYKTHFKRAYLTESAWLRGPGRELSTQQSADDGVVTSLG